MFRLTLDSESKDLQIEKVKALGMHKITIEPFKRNRKPPRCSNCLNLNHTAGRYKAPPKCKQCAQNHKTNQCTQNQEHTNPNTEKTKSTSSIHIQTDNKTTTIHTQTNTNPQIETQKTPKNKRSTKAIGTQTPPNKKPLTKKQTKTAETQTTIETTTRHMQTSAREFKTITTSTQTQRETSAISIQTDLTETEIEEEDTPQHTIEHTKDLTQIPQADPLSRLAEQLQALHEKFDSLTQHPEITPEQTIYALSLLVKQVQDLRDHILTRLTVEPKLTLEQIKYPLSLIEGLLQNLREKHDKLTENPP